jgi:hypothetical protein
MVIFLCSFLGGVVFIVVWRRRDEWVDVASLYTYTHTPLKQKKKKGCRNEAVRYNSERDSINQ